MTRSDDEGTVTAEDDLVVDYEALRFIELRGDGSKLPAKAWGGYDQDFDGAEHVHTHKDIEIHPSDEWGVVDCEDGNHTSRSLLIFDVDVHKAPEDFDPSRYSFGANTLVTRSQNGGFHVYNKVHAPRGEFSESDFEVHEEVPFDIDIRGSAVKHHVVAPNDIPGIGGEYEIVQNEPIQGALTPEDACQRVQIDGEPAIEYCPGIDMDWDGDRSTGAPDDEWLFVSDVQDALSHVNPDVGYSMWRDIGFAVAEYFQRVDTEEDARDAALETFTEWSKTGEKWDEDAERNAFNIIKNAFEKDPSELRDGPVTVGTLLKAAQQNGWEMPEKSERLALKTVREFIDEYDPVEDRAEIPDSDEAGVTDEEVAEAAAEWPDKDELNDVADAVPDLSDEDYVEHIDALTARFQPSRHRFDLHRELTQKMRKTDGNVVNHEGKLVIVNTDSRFVTAETLLNFEIDVTSRLSIEGEGRMANIEVRPSEPTESEFDLQIEPRVFNDARRFKDEVLAKRFSTTIETTMHESDVMDLLRKYISRQGVPDLVGQKQMGLSRNGDEFVTPNGTINADGWADEPETIHVERDIGAERKFAADPDEHDAGEIDNEDVARMIELFTRTRATERFLPVLGWMYAAPFRPEIVEHTGSFNLLHVNGESGVGKTGSLGVGSRMFGMSAEPFSCTDTTFAQITTLASSRSVPIWLDEYKVSEMPDWQTNKLHELLRKAATGGVEQRGQADQTTEEYHLRAPVVVSGETAIRGSAEQRRSISVTFTNRPTRSDSDEFHRFKELAGDATTDEDGNVSFPDARYDLEEHAVEYYRHVSDTSREEFEEKWFNAREYVSKRLAEWDVELDDLEVQGLQTVVFGFKVMRSFAHVVGADLSKLPDQDDLDDALRHVADVEGDGRETHIDQFTGLVQRAAVADYLEKGTHYDVVREGKSGEELRVNVTRAFDEVSKYVRDHDLNDDLLGSAQDYKSRHSEAVEQDTYVTCTSQGTPGVGRAVGIHTGRAEDKLAEFDRRVFTDTAVNHGGVEIDVDDGDDDDGPGGDRTGSDDVDVLRKQATSMARLGDRVGDYPTVTVEVVEWEPAPDKVAEADGPIAAGSVRDETGRRDVVMFDEDEPDGITYFEPGETVCVRDAPVTEYERSPQLRLDSGTTITQIQQGVGYTEAETPEDGQETLDQARSHPVEADGGETQRDRILSVKDIIKSVEGDDGATVDEVLARSDEKGFSKEKAEHEIEKLKHRGEVYEPAENRLRVTES